VTAPPLKETTAMFRHAGAPWLVVWLLAGASPLSGQGPAKKDKQPRVDVHGDALPDGALARMGTLRWRAPAEVSSVAFSPDGKMLVLSGARVRRLPPSNNEARARSVYDAVIQLRDVTTGKVVRQLEHPVSVVSALAFSPDGQTLAAGVRKDLAERAGWR